MFMTSRSIIEKREYQHFPMVQDILTELAEFLPSGELRFSVLGMLLSIKVKVKLFHV